MDTNILTAEKAQELLSYDMDRGILTRKVSLTNTVKIGDVAGSVNKKGYVSVGVNGRYYLAHRVIWLIVHGKWPSKQIDHINGIKTDNRICNLCEVSNSINAQNKKSISNNTSGLLGVSWLSKAKKWRAQIQVQGKVMYLGLYNDKYEAHSAYLTAKRKYHEGCVI